MYISEKNIKPISEKYIKSQLKAYFPIFLFKRSILMAHSYTLFFHRGLATPDIAHAVMNCKMYRFPECLKHGIVLH